MSPLPAAAHFELFGFAVLRGLLGDDEVGRLRAEVEDGLRDAFGARFGQNTRDDMPDGSDGTDATGDGVAAEGNFLPLMADRTPLSQHLVADDARLQEFAASVLGDCTIASPALATQLVADTPWHNDAGFGRRWLRLNAYLQPSTAASGALRIVPGSQHGTLAADIAARLRDDPMLRTDPDALPGVAVETQPGDVIAFDPRVHHGAWGGGRRLRWSIDFLPFPPLSDRERVEETASLIHELSDWPTTDRWPTWAEWAAGGGERRRSAITKLGRLGIL